MLVMGMLVAAGLQSPSQGHISPSFPSIERVTSQDDMLQQLSHPISLTASESGLQRQNQKPREIRLVEIAAFLACFMLILKSVPRRLPLPSGARASGEGSMLHQLHTQSLQL